MKSIILIATVLFSSISFSQNSWEQEGFELKYSFAGLGSNMGQSFTGFKLSGNHYELLTEVNSCLGGKMPPPELQKEGELPDHIMNDLMDVFNGMSDTSIYETNVSVMSGGVHTITMGSAVKMVKFTLHNATHPAAAKIIDLINSGIPSEENQLWLFEEPSNKTY